MNPRLRGMVLVGATIVSLTLLFLIVFIRQQKQVLLTAISNEQHSIDVQLKLLESQVSQIYTSRIKSFVKENNEVMKTFANGNREKLFQVTKPYYTTFTRENDFFKTLFFISPNNSVFLRMHKPKLFGDDVLSLSPIASKSNLNQKSMAGFEVAKMGLHYRLLQPVFMDGKYIGAVGFGIDVAWIVDILRANSEDAIGVFFSEEVMKRAVFVEQAQKVVGKQALFYNENSVLKLLPEHIDITQRVQRVSLQNTSYALLQGGSLNDFEGNLTAGILVAKNIDSLVNKTNYLILLTVVISLTLLIIAFTFLYISFGGLFNRITMLNSFLEEINKNLENQVAERTVELRQEVKEKDKAQATAVRSKEEWERTFDAVTDMISILDNQHRIVRANIAMTDHFCLPIQDVIDSKCYKIAHGLDAPPPYCPHVQLLNDHQPHTVETFNDRLQRHYSITVSPLKDYDGEFFGSVHIARDITDQKLAEEKLQKAEKMEAIGLMAGGVAHDLNNILSGVVSYPEVLLMQLSKNDVLYKPIAAIQESGKRAAAVVDDLLTIARGVATVKKSCSLNTLVDEYLNSTEFKSLQRLHPKVCVELELEEIWNILCSSVHIQKVLMNLITNAVEAIDSAGIVLVSTTNQTIDSEIIAVSSLEKGEYVVLTIQDSGSGIAKYDLERIFEPFYTKKVMGRSGTGLGLAVVWNTVKDHGAFIDVESDSNGTTFNLYFQPYREKATQARVDTDITTLKGSGTVLVVDDEIQQLTIASQMLAVLGYTVDTVASGEEAVAYCREKPVDILILDMLMAPGISGLETYRQIIEFSSLQKAVIASGFSESSSVLDAKALGVGVFIKKPYSLEQLGEAVQETLK
jgi:PAS domain S-box-containing protein